jgi:secreted protein with Ig-like and vWFA domain
MRGVELACAQHVLAGAGADRAVLIEFQVTLRDHKAQLSVPVQWQLQGEQLRASGAVEFRQSDLGLEPYSALLGALRVADSIAARFEIVARRSAKF